MTERPKHNEDIGRRAEEERNDAGVAKCGGQSGKEILESSCSGDAHVGKGQDVGLGVTQSEFETLDLRLAACFVDIGFGGFNGEPSVGDVLHLWREEFPSIRKVRKDENDDNTDSDGDNALDDIEPLPCRKPLFARKA